MRRFPAHGVPTPFPVETLATCVDMDCADIVPIQVEGGGEDLSSGVLDDFPLHAGVAWGRLL